MAKEFYVISVGTCCYDKHIFCYYSIWCLKFFMRRTFDVMCRVITSLQCMQYECVIGKKLNALHRCAMKYEFRKYKPN